MNRTLKNYILNENKGQFMIIILIIIAIIIYLIVIPNAHLLHDFLSYFLPVSTLCIGIFVWYNEQKENYMNQLPKKLNVKYQLDEKYFEIINPVDKASSNSTENQSYSIAFDLGRKSAIAKLPQESVYSYNLFNKGNYWNRIWQILLFWK